jgi:hypothetical protein
MKCGNTKDIVATSRAATTPLLRNTVCAALGTSKDSFVLFLPVALVEFDAVLFLPPAVVALHWEVPRCVESLELDKAGPQYEATPEMLFASYHKHVALEDGKFDKHSAQEVALTWHSAPEAPSLPQVVVGVPGTSQAKQQELMDGSFSTSYQMQERLAIDKGTEVQVLQFVCAKHIEASLSSTSARAQISVASVTLTKVALS